MSCQNCTDGTCVRFCGRIRARVSDTQGLAVTQNRIDKRIWVLREAEGTEHTEICRYLLLRTTSQCKLFSGYHITWAYLITSRLLSVPRRRRNHYFAVNACKANNVKVAILSRHLSLAIKATQDQVTPCLFVKTFTTDSAQPHGRIWARSVLPCRLRLVRHFVIVTPR